MNISSEERRVVKWVSGLEVIRQIHEHQFLIIFSYFTSYLNYYPFSKWLQTLRVIVIWKLAGKWGSTACTASPSHPTALGILTRLTATTGVRCSCYWVRRFGRSLRWRLRLHCSSSRIWGVTTRASTIARGDGIYSTGCRRDRARVCNIIYCKWRSTLDP